MSRPSEAARWLANRSDHPRVNQRSERTETASLQVKKRPPCGRYGVWRVDLGETKLQVWQQGGSLVTEATAKYFKQQNTKF